MGVDGRAVIEYALYTMHKAGYITDYDQVVANKLGWVLTGGEVLPETEVSEGYLLELEREAFPLALRRPSDPGPDGPHAQDR